MSAVVAFEGGYGQDFGKYKVAWRYVWCGGYDEETAEDGTTKRFFHHFTNKKCSCKPGPQVKALTSTAFEIALGGGRGGLKTETLLAFLVKGNPVPNPTDPVDISYVNHSKYRALVLRKNAKDLADFVSRAREFFAPYGAEVTESPMRIRFPSGAEILMGHMEDESSYMAYQGQQFQRIGLEELCQIPSEILYLRIIMSCRSPFEELKPQVLNTANPGGPGNAWFKKRFWDIKTKDGKPVRNGEIYTDEASGMTRTFIHSTVYDNPYFMRGNAMYVKQLELLQGVERRRWLFGDFECFEGQFFTEWREKQLEGEPPEARHVIPAGSVKLQPWWHRWVGMDWGFKHAAAIYWACQHPNGQIHIYRELIRHGLTNEELGEELALRSRDDIEGLPHNSMTFYISPDCWSPATARREVGQTIAEQIASGMQNVYGPNSAIAINTNKDIAEVVEETEIRRQANIVIRPAFSKRVEGWQYIHSLMRWKRLPSEIPPTIDMGLAFKHLREGNEQKYEDMLVELKRYKPVVLPRLQVWDCCKALIEAVPTAKYNDPTKAGLNPEDVEKTKTKEDDALDGIRYCLSAHKFRENEEPYQEFLSRRMAEIRGKYGELSGNALVFANRKAEADWAERHSGGGTFTLQRPWGRQTELPEEENDAVQLTRFLQ